MKFIILASVAVLGSSAFAAEKKTIDISCQASKGAYERIFVKLDDVDFEAGSVERWSASISSEEKSYDLVPDGWFGSTNGENLKVVPYKGTKYKGHIKFDLDESEFKGNFSPDRAELILSPEYKVVKTIPQQNNWDKTWTWDLEIRKHSAVLDASWNDHHGDYIQLDCYSVAIVNDSKGRN